MLFQDLTTVITPPSLSETTSFQASNYDDLYGQYYITWVSGPKPAVGTAITVTGTLTRIGSIVGTNVNGTVTLESSLATGILNKGQAFVLSGYGFPVNGLTATTYYIVSSSGTSVVLANSLANAMAGIAITSITSTGSGISSVSYSTNNAYTFGSTVVYGDYTNAGGYYLRIGSLYNSGNKPTSTTTLTCTYVTNRTYSEAIYTGLPTYSYITGSYYNPSGRYSSLTTNIWARGSGTTAQAYPQNLNLYSQYSNFELSNDLTGNYIGNILYELDCVMEKPSTSTRLYARYLENGTSNILYRSSGDANAKPLGSYSVPLATNYTITVVDNITNAIIAAETTPAAITTLSTGYAAISKGSYVDNNSSSVDYIIKIYAYDDPYNNTKLFSRLRAEDRFPVLNLRPKMWVTPNTFTYPVTQDGSLIITNSTSTNTNSYSDTIVTCLDYERRSNTTSSTLLTYYPQLTYMGYNDQDTASLKYSEIYNYNFGNIVEVYSGATLNTAKTQITMYYTSWGYRTPYPGIIMVDTYDWTTPEVRITAVSYSSTGYYTFTLSSAWEGTTRVGFKYDSSVSYKNYTKDPANILSANGETPSTMGYSYYYRQANQNRYLSAGFFTILPLYSVKKLDGTLIGTFRDTTLFTEITSPTTAINRNYVPTELTSNSTARWWTPGTTTEYSAAPPTKSAQLLRNKIQEFYYTYGPCVLEFTAVILKRRITSGQTLSARSPTGTTPISGYVVGAPTGNYISVADVKGYTETETTEIIRIKVQETVVPMITPPVRIIRPSSLIAFSTTAADYKISFNAARVITKYKDSNKILIESINATTNTITITNHGLKDNQIIRYGSYGTVAKGLKNNYYYYVVYYTANTFGLKMDSTAIDITSTGSPGDQYIYLDSDKYILTTQLSKISNSVISFDKPHNLISGDRVLFLAQSNTNISSYINLVHYTYYNVNRVDDNAIKLVDTANNPITITATPTIYPITITSSTTKNSSPYWYSSTFLDSSKDLIQLKLNWTVPYNVDYYTFDVTANSLDAITYEVYSYYSNIGGNYSAEIKVTTPTYTTTNYGNIYGITGTIAAGAASRTIRIQVKSLIPQGYSYQQGTLNFYVKFTKGSGVYLGNFSLAKLPDTVQEVTDKNAGYIGINTETAAQATPSKILSGLTGTNLNVKLYADKTTATQLSNINIPIISNLSGTNAITFQNSAAFYGLTEVGFLPTGADIKHYGTPLSNNNWNYVQYNTTNEKLNNKSTYSPTSNGDISINTNTSILGSSGSPANTITVTGHGLSTGAPVRISTYNQTTINTTNYNAITRVKRNGGGTGSWLGLVGTHDYVTGDIIMYQKGYDSSTATYLNLLSVLIPGRKYYISVVDTTWFKLCNSPEEAADGKGITFNSFGKFGTQIVEGVDTKTATVYFKYAQTQAADAVNYYYGTEENPVSAIYNQVAYDKTTQQLYGDNSTYRFKYPGPDSYSQQVYTTSTGSTLATSTFDNIVIGYLDRLTTFPKGINCYDTYYAIVVDANAIRLAKNYADAVATVPNYVLIEPATIGTTAYIYTGVTAPSAITSVSVIKDEILLGTQNPLALSICWAYTPGTTDTSGSNIDGFIVYVNTAGVAGSDPVNDYRYVVPYNDYYISGKYNIVVYNLPKLTSTAYVSVAAYRYRNHYDYRHNVFFGTDAQEFQRSKLLKDIISISNSTSDTTALSLADATTYTTTKRFFIPKTKLAYNGSQGYATPQSTLTIDGVAGTISLTKNAVNLTDADLKSKYTTESTASYYIPYLSTSGTYQYISSKETIYYSSKTVLQTYINTTNNKKALSVKFIPSNYTGISGITLNSSITAPVLINNVSIDTVTSPLTGSSITTTQKVISIGPTIVQNANQSLRLLIPVIDSSTNAVSIAEVYYQAQYNELSNLNFTTIIEVLGT